MDDDLTKLTYDSDDSGPSGGRYRVQGLATDSFWRDVVWVKSTPSAAEVLNPRRGEMISVRDYGKEFMGFKVWKVYPTADCQSELGEFHVLFQEENVALSYIETISESRGQGIARTILQWLGLRAYFEKKPLYIQDVYAPELETIARSLYPSEYRGYETDYGTTFSAMVDAEKIARHQRMDWLIRVIDHEKRDLAEKDGGIGKGDIVRSDFQRRLLQELRDGDDYRRSDISSLCKKFRMV